MRLLRHALLLSALAGCASTVYAPGAATRFNPEVPPQVDDGAIRAAFDARPQLGSHLDVAYYTFDPQRADEIEAMLHGLPGVGVVYRIPPLLVTGQRRFDAPRPWDPPRELGVAQLRLLAARAHCDALVVLDYGYRTERRANALAALDVLVLPALFAPFLDAHVESYLDAYVIDTRNGYLYQHVSSSRSADRGHVTVWSDAEEPMVSAQWTELLGDTRASLATLLAGSGSGG